MRNLVENSNEIILKIKKISLEPLSNVNFKDLSYWHGFSRKILTGKRD